MASYMRFITEKEAELLLQKKDLDSIQHSISIKENNINKINEKIVTMQNKILKLNLKKEQLIYRETEITSMHKKVIIGGINLPNLFSVLNIREKKIKNYKEKKDNDVSLKATIDEIDYNQLKISLLQSKITLINKEILDLRIKYNINHIKYDVLYNMVNSIKNQENLDCPNTNNEQSNGNTLTKKRGI